MGLAVEEKIVNIETVDRFAIPRLDCNDFPPVSEEYKTVYV